MKLTSKLAIALGATALTLGTLSYATAQPGDGHARMERGERHGDGHGGQYMQARQHRGDSDRGMGRMRGFLEAFDADGDGGLTQEEIDTARAERLAEFDTDGDGSLSLSEFEALWLDAMRERMVDQFQRHDDDGDGQVTAEEFGERFKGIVAARDTNGDGVLNADDMRRGPRRAPAE
ncbi:EF-hand domain-containing protein [Oceanibium sediminis]|uniref:EF-hand domain-containing protein n=1 Tax=Oceanibium sediminis TaxID=2026339 RepID=UPI000DD2E748|nr:EF-hand domain-containing protein [Oceanibium sediminis]